MAERPLGSPNPPSGSSNPKRSTSALGGASLGAKFKVDDSDLRKLHTTFQTLIKDVKALNDELGKTQVAGSAFSKMAGGIGGSGHASGANRAAGMPAPPGNFNAHISTSQGGGGNHQGGGGAGGSAGNWSIGAQAAVTAASVTSNVAGVVQRNLPDILAASQIYRNMQLGSGGTFHATQARQFLFGGGNTGVSRYGIGGFGSFADFSAGYQQLVGANGPGFAGTGRGQGAFQAAGRIGNLTGSFQQGADVITNLQQPQTYYRMNMVGVNLNQFQNDPEGFAKAILLKIYRGKKPTAANIEAGLRPGGRLRFSLTNLGLDEDTINFIAQYGEAWAAGGDSISLAPARAGGRPAASAANKKAGIGTNAFSSAMAAGNVGTGITQTIGAHTSLAGYFTAIATAGGTLLQSLQGFIGAIAGGAGTAGMAFGGLRNVANFFGLGGLFSSVFGGGGGGSAGGLGGSSGLGGGGGGGGLLGGGGLGGLLGTSLGLYGLTRLGGAAAGGIGRAGSALFGSLGGLFSRGGAAAAGYTFDAAGNLIPKAGAGLLSRLAGSAGEGILGKLGPIGAALWAGGSLASTGSAMASDFSQGKVGEGFKAFGHNSVLNLITMGMAGRATNAISDLTQGHYMDALKQVPGVGDAIKFFSGIHGSVKPPSPNYTGMYNGVLFKNGQPVGGSALGGNASVSSMAISLSSAGRASSAQLRNPRGGSSNSTGKSSLRVVRPVNAPVTQEFGHNGHPGTDYGAPCNTPIQAVEDGVVIDAGPAQGFGMWIVIQHPDGYYSVYGHMFPEGVLVHIGQQVKAGDVIGKVGWNGYVIPASPAGCHLHLEIHNGWPGTRVNPEAWLNGHGAASVPGTGVSGGGNTGTDNNSQQTSGSAASSSAVTGSTSNYGSREEIEDIQSALSGTAGMVNRPKSSSSNSSSSSSGSSTGALTSGSGTINAKWADHLPAAGKKYAQDIANAAHATGVNPAMIAAVAQHESGFVNGLESQDGYGSWGLMQFIPSTGAAYGLKSIADHNNPAKDLLAGAKYLKDLLNQAHGNVYAAYRGYASGDVNSPYADANARARELTAIFDSYGDGPGLGNYRQGAYRIKRDQAALVHQDEMVLQNHEAAMIRSAVRQSGATESTAAVAQLVARSSGSSPSVTVHLTAPIQMVGGPQDARRFVEAAVREIERSDELKALMADQAGVSS